jgi:nucleoside-diphosphate-sugar epimerase
MSQDWPKRIAVTGAAGELGRGLIRRLAEEPAVEHITALDRGFLEPVSDKVHFHQVDVRSPTIGELFVDIDAVAHLAFIVEHCPDESEIDSINIGGSRNVFRSAAEAGVAHITYASSIAAYGFHPENHGVLLDESTPIRGNESFYYTRTKAEVEGILDELETDHPTLRVARLRPTIFFGRDSRRRQRFSGPVVPYMASPPIQLTHLDDVVEAFALAIGNRAHGAYNVSTDEPLPMSEWARVAGKIPLRIPRAMSNLAELAYRRGKSDVHPDWLRVGADHSLTVSNAKLKRELGWQPQFPTTAAAAAELLSDAPPTNPRGRALALAGGLLSKVQHSLLHRRH